MKKSKPPPTTDANHEPATSASRTDEQLDEFSTEIEEMDEQEGDGKCPFCQSSQTNCPHLVADIDLTFASFDAGSLKGAYETALGLLGEGEQETLLMDLCDFLQDEVSGCISWLDESDSGRPGTGSQNLRVWADDPDGVAEDVKARFLP